MNTRPIPMTGKLLKVILAKIAEKPDKDSGERVSQSIGVGAHSIVATDNRSAVLVGELDAAYEPTRRNSALLEAARAEIYADTVDPKNIERFCDPESGAMSDFPNIAKVMEWLNSMVHVMEVSPKLLLAAAQAAVAAEADKISLYIKKVGYECEGTEGYSVLGAAFDYRMDVEQLTLGFGDEEDPEAPDLFAPVPCRLLIAGMNNKGKQDASVEVHPEPTLGERLGEAMKDNLQELADEVGCGVSITTAKGTKSAAPIIDEEQYRLAVAYVREKGQASTSMLQRQFSIGFWAASHILDRMEAEGVVGPRDGPRPREVLPEKPAEPKKTITAIPEANAQIVTTTDAPTPRKPGKKPAPPIPVPESQTFTVELAWQGAPRSFAVKHEPIYNGTDDRFAFAPDDMPTHANLEPFAMIVPNAEVPAGQAVYEYARDLGQRHIDATP